MDPHRSGLPIVLAFLLFLWPGEPVAAQVQWETTPPLEVLVAGSGFGLTPQAIYAVVEEDFDGDGHRDIAAYAGIVDTVGVFLGTGTGQFQTLPPMFVGNPGVPPPPPSIVLNGDLATGDFNADGIPDIIITNQLSDLFSLLIGDGLGGFQASFHPTNPEPGGIAVADFDEDGHLDLVLTQVTAYSLTLHLGLGTGLFQPPQVVCTLPSAASLINVVATDVDSDDHLDLVVPFPLDATFGFVHQAAVLLGTGAGSFSCGNTVVYVDVGTSSNSYPARLIAVDLDGDGDIDLASANSGSNDLGVVLGDGLGGFSLPVGSPIGGYPINLIALPIDGDGLLDIAVSIPINPTIAALRGTGAGSFAPPVITPTSGLSPITLATGDFDTDGRADLAVGTFNGPAIEVFLNRTPGNPTAEFQRGDANGDASRNLADAIFLLAHLFVPGSPVPGCADATDCDDDGAVNIADAIVLLNSLFVPGAPAIPPPDACGVDPSPDTLDCAGTSCP